MNGRVLRWIFLMVLGLSLGPVRAFYIRLHGVVTEHATGDAMKGVQIRLVKDSIERETVITPWNGSYELFLERGYDYIVWFYREDLVTKHVRIDAREIPLFPDVPFYDMDLQMTLFTWIEGFDFSVLDAPIGMAAYKHSVRNLNWDIEYTDRMRVEVARMMVLYEREVAARRKQAAKEGSTLKKKVNRRRVYF
ncbi:MAG: hypothetical protein JNL52_03015 [Flavobacteriales bacterium]|nr:hypothetical protein [Flavobacteriales bacterium]